VDKEKLFARCVKKCEKMYQRKKVLESRGRDLPTYLVLSSNLAGFELLPLNANGAGIILITAKKHIHS
jgi:hypothetical protein